METVPKLLNRVKALNGIESAYALAKILDCNKGLISTYYKGTNHPNEYVCLKISQALKLDLDEVLTVVRIAAEKDEKRRQEWQKYYKSIGGIAASFAMVVFAACILIVTPTTAKASIQAVCAPTHFVLCKAAMLLAYLKRKLHLRQIRLKPQFCMSVV